jgi:hypothetical protein
MQRRLEPNPDNDDDDDDDDGQECSPILTKKIWIRDARVFGAYIYITNY